MSHFRPSTIYWKQNGTLLVVWEFQSSYKDHPTPLSKQFKCRLLGPNRPTVTMTPSLFSTLVGRSPYSGGLLYIYEKKGEGAPFLPHCRNLKVCNLAYIFELIIREQLGQRSNNRMQLFRLWAPRRILRLCRRHDCLGQWEWRRGWAWRWPRRRLHGKPVVSPAWKYPRERNSGTYREARRTKWWRKSETTHGL